MRVRLIPARAGKTRSRAAGAAYSAAHPRAGGENFGSIRKARSGRGSSPRGRGKLLRLPCGRPGCGLIPARAGKTAPGTPRRLTATAHPRAGGENPKPGGWGRIFRGSSPRGRGKLRLDQEGPKRTRLIPARAGKTVAAALRAAWLRAHPRAGGENCAGDAEAVDSDGSSPRGRGKRLPARRSRTRRGLIPARAGKTDKDGTGTCTNEAHPRAGGENACVR